jgi:hypothetical protein
MAGSTENLGAAVIFFAKLSFMAGKKAGKY